MTSFDWFLALAGFMVARRDMVRMKGRFRLDCRPRDYAQQPSDCGALELFVATAAMMI
jgi:hypothetical protein